MGDFLASLALSQKEFLKHAVCLRYPIRTIYGVVIYDANQFISSVMDISIEDSEYIADAVRKELGYRVSSPTPQPDQPQTPPNSRVEEEDGG